MLLIFSEWAALLPWASLPTFNAEGSSNGRSLWTTNRMSAIIRYIGDVLQFQYELSNRRGSVEQQPSVDEPSSSRASPAAETPTSTTVSSSTVSWLTPLKSRKRRPRGELSAQRVISLLLQPTRPSKLPQIDPSESPEDVQDRLSRIELQVLHGLGSNSSRYRPLTRLEALTLERGGQEYISDEELFEPGELDGYQNSIDDAIMLSASHPEWDDIVIESRRVLAGANAHGRNRVQSGTRARTKATKAGMRDVGQDDPTCGINDEDDMELDGDDGEDLAGGGQRHSRSRLSAKPAWGNEKGGNAEEDDGESDKDDTMFFGKEAYLGFGLFPGWEGDDPDTVRYFESMDL